MTLAEEVEYLQRYVDIQKVRFGERLGYSVDIPEALMDTQVPSLLLQPLVENAIKHGLAERVAGGEIRVAAVRKARPCASASIMTARTSRPIGSRRAPASASRTCARDCRSCTATPPISASGAWRAAVSKWS